MEYLNWKEEKINDFSEEKISSMYNNGFVFTRIDKGTMQQTRSVRIDLNKFELSSENRRILRKGEEMLQKDSPEVITIPYTNYSWSIGKLAKDFYDKKADGAFSANKIKELITTNHNFNLLLSFKGTSSEQSVPSEKSESLAIGYTICYKNSEMIHYCYPFYDLEKSAKDMGLVMMTKTIAWAKSIGLKYIYLGSLQRPGDVYKLQFSGIEWFDGEKWSTDIDEVKKILK